MTYPFVAAKYFTAGGMIQPRAVVVHMAEGAGTVSWLTHPTSNNSSHFVIEGSGQIVQMVREYDASHSLHVAFDADLNDAPTFGIYSPQAAQAVLGADGFANPNAYIFAVEVEGYAAVGPNAAQTAALTRLVTDLLRRHPTIRGNLGHRDFQDYKACPGGKVNWAAIGGHGRYATLPVEEDDMKIEHKIERWTFGAGPGQVTTLGAPFRLDGSVDYSKRLAYLSDHDGENPRLEMVDRFVVLSAPDASLDEELRGALAAYVLPTTGITQAQLDAAVAAGKAAQKAADSTACQTLTATAVSAVKAKVAAAIA